MGKSATSFQPGQSGNPGGRPKLVAEVRDLAREHTEEAIETLATIMRNEKAPPAARVSAAESILSRGWGKAPQEIRQTTEPEELRKPDVARLAEAAKALEKDSGPEPPELRAIG
jgi:hypothetical protein